MNDIGVQYQELSMATPNHKDLMRFLSIRARGHVLQIGMENGAGTCALLYGVQTKGGHVWTINTTEGDQVKFAGHPQWTFLESYPLNIDYVRGAGVPEETDLIYIKSEPIEVEAIAILRTYGQTLKTKGLIVVADVKKTHSIHQACDDYAKSYGMKYHVRPGDADLGVIFFPENQEALLNE